MHLRLPPTPSLLVRELIALAAQRRTYVLRTLYASGLFILVLALSYRQFVALNSGSMEVLGSGGHLFDTLMAAQFAGIYLFLPLLVAPLVTDEDERGNLDLLLVSGISPLAFLLQKLASRLIGMGSFLLLALPIGGIAFTLGGVDERRLLAGALALALCTLQVGALCLWLGARAHSSLRALGSAYLLGPVLLFVALPVMLLVPILLLGAVLRSLGFALIEDAFAIPMSFYSTVTTRSYSVAGMLLASLPMLLSTLGCLWLAHRALLRRRTTLSPQMRQQMRIYRPERISERRRRQRVVALNADGGALPADQPLAWREIRRTPGLRAKHRSWLWVGLPLLAAFGALFAGIDHAEGVRSNGQAQVLPGMLWCLYLATVPTIAVLAAGLISGERLRHSLEILLVTPLSSVELVTGKLAGCNRLVWSLLALVAYIAGLVWWVEISDAHARGGGAVVVISMRLVTTLLTAWLYLRLTVWLALAASMRLRVPTQAAVSVLGLICAWCVLPPLALDVLRDLSHHDPTLGWGRLLTLLSPVGALLASADDRQPWIWLVLANSLLYGGLLWLVRWDCLRRADRLLGRAG